MKSNFTYIYANLLCIDVVQYITIVAAIYADVDKDFTEDFWQRYKTINDTKPRAKWNRNQKRRVK